MNHISHYTTQRGGKFMSGDSAAGDNIVNTRVDTPEYSHHNLSHTIRTTATAGELYPIDTITCVTGDAIKLDGNLTTMFTPTNKPFLDEWEQYLHAYFVPNRNLDPTWQQFFTGGKDGKYSNIRPCFNMRAIQYLVNLYDAYPDTQTKINYDLQRACDYGQILDLFNLPCGIPTDSSVSTSLSQLTAYEDESMPVLFDKFIAYQRIYNDFYRMPEWENDMFMDIAMTPTEVAQEVLTAVLNTSTSASQSIKNEYVTAYKTLSKDGYFWKFFQWLCDTPTGISTNGLGYNGSSYVDMRYDVTFIKQTAVNDADYAVGGSARYPNCLDFCFSTALGTRCNYIMDLANSNCHTIGTGTHALYTSQTNKDKFDKAMGSIIAAFLSLVLKPHSMCYERDRYNTCLPYTQRGVGAVLMNNIVSTMNSTVASSVASGASYSPFKTFGDTLDASYYILKTAQTNAPLYAAFTKQDLKNLSADTRFLEKSARFGYRYSEYIRGIFGIVSDETEVYEKPHYLGGLKSGINASRVTNMAATEVSETGAVQIGQWSGEAGTNVNGEIGSWAAAENGVIMMIYCCKPRLSYMNINDPENHKVVDRTQYFTPDYANIQEQIQYVDELIRTCGYEFSNEVNGNNSGNMECNPWGNVPRYNEYRQIPSTTHGNFCNPQMADYQAFTCSRDMSQYYTKDFVEANHVRPYDDDIQRIFQVAPEDFHPLIIEFGVGVDANRLVPAYTPTL